ETGEPGDARTATRARDRPTRGGRRRAGRRARAGRSRPWRDRLRLRRDRLPALPGDHRDHLDRQQEIDLRPRAVRPRRALPDLRRAGEHPADRALARRPRPAGLPDRVAGLGRRLARLATIRLALADYRPRRPRPAARPPPDRRLVLRHDRLWRLRRRPRPARRRLPLPTPALEVAAEEARGRAALGRL
ncbi:MAG: hypothetical protein AVDCRST_MAG18-2714, partial [uncultured Thermomicrobiales bacterium]